MKLITSILILVSVASMAFTEEVDIDATYFHPAASLYIQGHTASASNLVAQGLASYPNDGKLKRLKELLEKQQEQEQQQQNPENKDEQKQENKKPPQDPEEKENEPQEPDEEPREQEPQQEQQPAEPESAEQMSADEAKQLLNAARQEEKNKRLQLHPVIGAPVKVDKDW